MRRGSLGVGILAVTLGCGGKYEAKSGKDFFSKIQKAQKEQDVDTLRKMMSKKSQDTLLEAMKTQVEAVKTDAKQQEKFQKELGLTEDPSTMKLEDVVKALLKQELKENAKDADKEQFVEEKAEGETVILVTQEAGKEKKEIVLVRENGYLKWDMEASDKREEQKRKRG